MREGRAAMSPGGKGTRVWYVLVPDDEIQYFNTATEAETAAKKNIEYHKYFAADEGWPEDIACLQWGYLAPCGKAELVDRQASNEETEEEGGKDWQLIPVEKAEEEEEEWEDWRLGPVASLPGLSRIRTRQTRPAEE